MKGLFLATMERGESIRDRSEFAGAPFAFVPYSYGPFTPSVYPELESLRSQGLVLPEYVPGRNYAKWALTDEGHAAATDAGARLSPEERERLARASRIVRERSFNSLLEYVYERYPDYASESVHPAAKQT